MEKNDESEFEEYEEGEFIVERIINHKFINGKCYYLLKWKDFDDRENTWEEESSLDCPDLLEEYHDLNVERIEQDRILSQEIERRKKEKKKKELSLLKQIIDNNYSLSVSKKINDESSIIKKQQFRNESSNNISQNQQIEKKEDKQSDFNSEIPTVSTIPNTPKLPNSKWLTIIGHKTDINGQLLFSIAKKDGKIIYMSKSQLMSEDINLYLRYLEESFLLKLI